MAPKMAPETIAMACLPPTNALPQTDKPNFEGAAVIPEGIVNNNSSSTPRRPGTITITGTSTSTTAAPVNDRVTRDYTLRLRGQVSLAGVQKLANAIYEQPRQDLGFQHLVGVGCGAGNVKSVATFAQLKKTYLVIFPISW